MKSSGGLQGRTTVVSGIPYLVIVVIILYSFFITPIQTDNESGLDLWWA